MTDTAVAVAAPAVEAPAPQQDAPQEAPKTAQEFLQKVNKGRFGGGEQVKEAVAPTPGNQPRDPETGKFVPKNEQPQTAAPVEESAKPTQDAPQQEFVQIPLPQGHPLRSRGKEYLTVPKEEEEYGRWAVNQAVRNAQVETLERERRKLSEQMAETQAREAFWRENSSEFFGADFLQTYEDLKASYGEEQAELFRRGRQMQAQEKLQEKLQEQKQQQQQLYVQTEAKNFANQAFDFSRSRYKGWADNQIEFALASYASMIDATGQGFDGKSFQAHADALYLRDPQVQQRAVAAQKQRQQSEVEKLAEKRVTELEKKRMDEYNKKRLTNPLGGTPPIATDRTVPLARSDGPKTAAEFIRQTERKAKGLSY